MERTTLAALFVVGIAASGCASTAGRDLPTESFLAASPVAAGEEPASGEDPWQTSEFAPAPVEEKDRWRFSVTPFLWFPTLDSRVTVDGKSASTSTSFQDLASHLDLAVMAHAEARKGPWGVFIEGTWTDLSSEGTPPALGETTVSMQQFIGEGAVAYRFFEGPVGSGEGEEFKENLSLDVYAGARYTRFHTKVNPTAYGSATDSMDWIDGIVGARARFEVSPKVSLFAVGDGGGFQGNDDNSWFFMGGLEWKPSAAYGFQLTYAVLQQKYSEGGGSGDPHLSIKMSGPMLGFAFYF
jgi:hypothetical protein